MGVVCPVCGKDCGYRQIKEYYRTVRELFPVQVGRVPVARFQCLGIPGRLPTFSMLPHQLVPYFQHTLESMVRTAVSHPRGTARVQSWSFIPTPVIAAMEIVGIVSTSGRAATMDATPHIAAGALLAWG